MPETSLLNVSPICVNTVIIPFENEKDLQEIDPIVRNGLNFIIAEHVDTVLENALYSKEEPVAVVFDDVPTADMKRSSSGHTICQ